MAISALEYLVVSTLRDNGALPPKPRVLEFGESNWYGDVSLDYFKQGIDKYVQDPAERAAVRLELDQSLAAQRPNMDYEVARIWFRALFDHSSYASIDPGTPSSTHRFNLTQPVPLQERFDITINFGTAEHIFNIHQFFKTVHDLTVEGGLMIHTAPCTGWVDHGFFTLQPTLFYDLAQANGYDVICVVCAQLHPFAYVQIPSRNDLPQLLKEGKIPQNSVVNVVFRKAASTAEFKTPIQAIYSGQLSPQAIKAWDELR